MADDGEISGHFRKDFMWGTATASYQIEGDLPLFFLPVIIYIKALTTIVRYKHC